MQITGIYELSPIDNRKSFYSKAKVYTVENGAEILFSYDTPIVRREITGKLVRLWSGWSATTGRHIKAFCGLNKAEFLKLPTE